MPIVSLAAKGFRSALVFSTGSRGDALSDDHPTPLQIRDDLEGADHLLAEIAWNWGEHRAAMFRYFAAELQQAAPRKLPPWAARLLCRWSIEALR